MFLFSVESLSCVKMTLSAWMVISSVDVKPFRESKTMS